MKNFFAIISFLFLCQIIIAESSNEFEGIISTTAKQVLTYKIVYKVNKDNTIDGYSLTDIEGEKLTKSWIKGIYNPSKKTLSFKETGNAFSKTKDNESTFCFVVADNLKIKTVNGKTVISGEFKAAYPSGKVGAKGNLFLVESNSLKKIKLAASSMLKAKNQTRKIKPETIDNDDTTSMKEAVKSISDDQKIVLTSNEKLIVECSKKSLTLDVWDGAYVDGDCISVYLNNKVLAENISLTATKKTIKFTAPAEIFKLKIVALNTGERGGNSACFEVKDKNNVKPFISKLNKDESFEIEFHVK